MPNIVKNTTFTNPLDLLAPHSCRGCDALGSALCDRCKKYILTHQHNLCPHCKADNPTGDCPACPDLPPTFIGGERSGLLGDIIHDYKYHSIRALAYPLAEIMAHALPTFQQPTYIVPLPTISSHIRTRGFDHTLLVARRLSKLTSYPVRSLLIRAKNTVQVGATSTTRRKQASTAYQLSPKCLIDQEAIYILLDDVWTTGASIRACQKLLEKAGATHLALALLSLSRIN
ncbi:ComF family protein [Candidatus Saccharibacteria bacterium]|nr:ComF family protein [Candidatus Saccharibacteria bacterium]